MYALFNACAECHRSYVRLGFALDLAFGLARLGLGFSACLAVALSFAFAMAYSTLW